MPPARGEVDRALTRLVRVLGVSRAEWLSSNSPSKEEDDQQVLQTVTEYLYAKWYTEPEQDNDAPAAIMGRETIAAALRAAVAPSSRWETGWVAMRVAGNGACLGGHGDRTRELRLGDYVNVSRPGLPVAPGDAIAVSACIDWVDAQTGLWHLVASTGPASEPLVRLYWSVGHEDVGSVLGEVVALLDRMAAPYQLKCPARAPDYRRADSLVAYLERGSWPALEPQVLHAARRLRDRLRPFRPPLTQRLGRGVSFAEDPGQKQSFGESRCRALAPGALAVLREPPRSLRAGVAVMKTALSVAGIDPERPWLNPNGAH